MNTSKTLLKNRYRNLPVWCYFTQSLTHVSNMLSAIVDENLDFHSCQKKLRKFPKTVTRNFQETGEITVLYSKIFIKISFPNYWFNKCIKLSTTELSVVASLGKILTISENIFKALVE